MSGARFAEGDRVVRKQVVGAGDAAIKRTYEGVVIDTGKAGVQVKFDDPRIGVKWVRNSEVEVLDRAKPDKPARVDGRALVVVPPPPIVAGPQQAAKVRSDIEAWRDMGRALIDEARALVAFSKEEREVLRLEVEEAKKRYQDAEAAITKAEAELADLMRITGGGA